MLFLSSSIVLIDFFTILVGAELTAVINTTTGPVQGEILTTINSVKYAVFSGIRYGKAPVGYLRFKPPVAADPWTEIFNATVEGDPCIQYHFPTDSIFGSEDCLFFNIRTPVVDLTEPRKNLKSVIFWIYGGGFLVGSCNQTTTVYRPEYYLENDIVFVCLNYRSGIFGYMALGLANATGNAGLKDLVLGLKWVQANIKEFGGNPNNVTLMGGSSGAAIVQYLILSDAAAGLFHGAISMSGTPLSTWAFQTPAKALLQTEKLAKLMGITWTDKESLLEAFYNAPAEQIVDATSKMRKHFGPFSPTIEDKSIATDVFMSECSAAKYISGSFNKVPQLLGFTEQETVSFVGSIQRIHEIIEQSLSEVERSHLTLPPSIVSAKNRLDTSTDFYENLNYIELRKFINDTSNLIYIAPLDQTQKLIASNNDHNPVYYYELLFFAPGPHFIDQNNTLPGAGHGDDVPVVFYAPHVNYTNNPTARLTRHRVTTMWSNFVKYGNPTPDWMDDNSLNFTWPDSGNLGLCLKIGSELYVDSSSISENAKCLQNRTRPFLREANGCE